MTGIGDQFIELLNTAGFAVDLSGWTLGDDDDGRPFLFPAGFGPGMEDERSYPCSAGGLRTRARNRLFFSAGGRIGDGLDAEDRILLIVPAGPDTLVDVRYTEAA